MQGMNLANDLYRISPKPYDAQTLRLFERLSLCWMRIPPSFRLLLAPGRIGFAALGNLRRSRWKADGPAGERRKDSLPAGKCSSSEFW